MGEKLYNKLYDLYQSILTRVETEIVEILDLHWSFLAVNLKKTNEGLDFGFGCLNLINVKKVYDRSDQKCCFFSRF